MYSEAEPLFFTFFLEHFQNIIKAGLDIMMIKHIVQSILSKNGDLSVVATLLKTNKFDDCRKLLFY